MSSVVPISRLGRNMNASSRVLNGDIYEDHVVLCAVIAGIKHRHNGVRDTLIDFCYRSGISAGNEVDIGLDGGCDKPLRPAVILLYSWDGDFVPGRAVIDAAQRTVTLLKRIRKFSMVQDNGACAAVQIFNRICFAIAEGLAPGFFPRDIYGDHVVSCAGIIGIKHRRDVFRDTLVDICFRSSISAGKEVDIRLSGGGDKPLRRADMLLYSRAVIDETQCKRVKYKAKCADIGYGFLPFSFSSFGELENDVAVLLKRIHMFSVAQDIGARAVVHIFTGKEVDIVLGAGHKPLRPVDMFPYSWNEWLNVCVKLTGSSPFTQNGLIDFVSRRAVIEVAQRKYVKYEAKCADIGYGFLPFTFSSFRELEKDAVTILKRIRKFSVTHDIMACNVVHIFSSISFGIVTPRQGGNTRRNIMDIITTQWCQQ
ncbi:hypothetical protein Tco_0265815 [Tanacetum coccineum]